MSLCLCLSSNEDEEYNPRRPKGLNTPETSEHGFPVSDDQRGLVTMVTPIGIVLDLLTLVMGPRKTHTKWFWGQI